LDSMTTSHRSTSGRRLLLSSSRATTTTTHHRGGGVSVSRPPVLLEISSSSCSSSSSSSNPIQIKAGYVGQAQPRHVVAAALGGPSGADEQGNNHGMATVADLYRTYSPVLHQALSLLMSQDLSERKVVVLFDTGLHIPDSLREALATILLENANLMAVSFQSSLQMTAFAVHLPSVLVVYISQSSSEAHCMAFSSHRALQYTYQACGGAGADYSGKRQHDLGGSGELVKYKIDAVNNMMDANSASCVALAVVKCLELCPRECRKDIIGNLLFAGDVYTPDLGVRVARQVRAILRGGGDKDAVADDPANTTEEVGEDEVRLDRRADDAGSGAELTPSAVTTTVTTRVPVRISELKSLAEHVGVIEASTIRPDMLAWMGASVWSSHWHSIDPDSECFRWRNKKNQ